MARTPSSADVFLALASPTRRQLLDKLSSREQSVRSLAAPFRMSLAAVSQQLRILRAAGLVSSRRIGRYRVYHLHGDRLREVALWTQKYERFWLTRPTKPAVVYESQAPSSRPMPDGQWHGE
jgi:DNA-binding transcriptional ArsR family regulator